MTQITHNLARVRSRIVAASESYDRKAGSVRLLAVSKMQATVAIQEALAQGQRHFGENFVHEAIEKQALLAKSADSPIEPVWHFIGKTQSNKTRLIAEHFSWVHSVDRFKIAQRLNQARCAESPLNTLVQVNLTGQANRAGVDYKEVAKLCESIARLPRLQLRGLMGIAPASDCFDNQSLHFSRLAEVFHQLQRHYPHFDALSMGMSGDLEAAIAHGATWVRIGTDIFGKRQPG